MNLYRLGLMTLAIVTTMTTARADAFEELNAQRRNFGLPPMVEDPELSRWAQMKAEWQAARGVSLYTGGNGHEGPNCGAGYTEGTGCLEPSWGWATCAMRTYGSPVAGAGLAIGTDGKRYMCLVIRGTGHREWSGRRSVINTSHLSPDAPVISTKVGNYQRKPIGQYTPTRYPGLDLKDFLAGKPVVAPTTTVSQSRVCPRCGKVH